LVLTLERPALSIGDIRAEYARCAQSPAYFIDTYIQIEDATAGVWVPFKLWPAQVATLRDVHHYPWTVILKARQLGLTWLILAYILWRKLFRPATTALLFSRREDEAKHLLERLTGMWQRLPDWLQLAQAVTDNTVVWELDSGSEARAFPTSAGDSYTASIVLADEFDLVEDQGKLIGAVKPTIDAGGKMILLSRVDKDRPQTQFKNIYRAAREGKNGWRPAFLPWNIRPSRTAAWYETQRQDSLARTGSLDDLHEQYPATEEEALAPRSLNKRIALGWLDQCYARAVTIDPIEAPAVPGLHLYREPIHGHSYVVGADPAEGNPTSDDSALSVLDRSSGEEVATLAGKFQPSEFARYIKEIGGYFKNADVMCERNNHGHAVLLYLAQNASELRRLPGHDGRDGWNSSVLGKTKLYDVAADAFRHGETRLHTMETYLQLASIEGGTLRAPEGEHDDRADGYALALVGKLLAPATFSQFNYREGDGYGEDGE
jgi:hypothetical protein